jgi:hypothetical protein
VKIFPLEHKKCDKHVHCLIGEKKKSNCVPENSCVAAHNHEPGTDNFMLRRKMRNSVKKEATTEIRDRLKKLIPKKK